MSHPYRYTDPTTDPGWPRIEAHDPATEPCADDLFPPGWGAEPTPRDQAAIDAGNSVPHPDADEGVSP